MELARVAYDAVLEDAKLKPEDVNYVATTGEAESVPFHTGHFYSMTTHARGAIYLDPEARAALDIGALHGRAIRIDERGKVLNYKMTSQCASGSGQFLENIARYLGIAQDEIGSLSTQADNPEVVVQHLRRAGGNRRDQHGVARHHRAQHPEGHPSVDGGAAVQAAQIDRHDQRRGHDDRRAGARQGPGGGDERGYRRDQGHERHRGAKAIRTRSIAGAIGAALWGAYRYEKLAAQGNLPPQPETRRRSIWH